MRTLVAAVALSSLCPLAHAEGVFSEISEQANFDLALVASDMRNPSSVAFTSSGDALISGWYGDLWRLPAGDGELASLSLSLDLADGRGFRTVSPHPEFAMNRTLYFCYASGTGDRNQTHIARGQLDGDAVQDVEIVFRAENFSEGRLHQRLHDRLGH